MKSRHIAALALVGWYLIVPPASDWKRLYNFVIEPPTHYAHGAPFYPAPFAKWEKLGEFYSQVNCENTREFIVHHDGVVERRPLPENPSLSSIPTAKQYQANAATCIASDDPRLKEK